MSQETELQTTIFNTIKKAICDSVEASQVNKGAIEITTPFIDWKGCPLSIYVTHDGQITDAGDTINQLRALRVYEDFEEWVFQEDYFHQNQIQVNQGKLEPINPESGESLIAYLQGIARLPSFFDPKPIRSPADYYPTQVKDLAILGLIEDYQLSISEAKKYVMPRPIKLKSHIPIESDMSPNRENVIIKIVSHSNDLPTAQNAHVSLKILPQVLMKKENNKAQACVVIANMDEYTPLSKRIIKSEANIIVETLRSDSKHELAKILVEA